MQSSIDVSLVGELVLLIAVKTAILVDITSKELISLKKKLSSQDLLDEKDLRKLTMVFSLIDNHSKEAVFAMRISKRLDKAIREKLLGELTEGLWSLTEYGFKIGIRDFFEAYPRLALDLSRAQVNKGSLYFEQEYIQLNSINLYFNTHRKNYVDLDLESLNHLNEIFEYKESRPDRPFFERKIPTTSIKFHAHVIPEIDFPTYMHYLLRLLEEGSNELKHIHWFFITRYLANAGYSEKEVHVFLKRSPRYKKALASPQVEYIFTRAYGPPSLTELKSAGLINDEDMLSEKNLFPSIKA